MRTRRLVVSSISRLFVHNYWHVYDMKPSISFHRILLSNLSNRRATASLLFFCFFAFFLKPSMLIRQVSQLLFTANVKGSKALAIALASGGAVSTLFLFVGFSTSIAVRLCFGSGVFLSLRFCLCFSTTAAAEAAAAAAGGRLVSSHALFLEACNFLRASTVTLIVAIGSTLPVELALAATAAA